MTRSNEISIDVPVERPIGLKRNGIDDSWCHEKRKDMSPERREERVLSDKMRHDLKVMRRSATRPIPEIRLTRFSLDLGGSDLLNWYSEYAIRAAFLFKKWAFLLTPKRVERERTVEGYVPGPVAPVYNSVGAKFKGITKDIHRAGVTAR
jgi:hypothetical protein